LLLWKSSKYYIFWVCFFNLNYPARISLAPCYIVIRLPYFFPHYLINGTIFVKTFLNTKCVFLFSLQLLSEIFLILRRIQQDIIINVNYPTLLSYFNETWTLVTYFPKILKCKMFSETIQSVCLSFRSMRTDGQPDVAMPSAILRMWECSEGHRNNLLC
jgi:hypothetical protein